MKTVNSRTFLFEPGIKINEPGKMISTSDLNRIWEVAQPMKMFHINLIKRWGKVGKVGYFQLSYIVYNILLIKINGVSPQYAILGTDPIFP